MRKIILPLAIAAMLAGSCTKETASRLDDIVNGDDHGGRDGSGHGGDNIPASSVPGAVMNAFNETYPGASVREWKRLDNGNYKVVFSFDGSDYEATFSPSGELLKAERD